MVALFLTLVLCLVSASVAWEGKLIFSEDFNGESLRKHYWATEEGCRGKWIGDKNLECFRKGPGNVRVENGTLILSARPEISKEYVLGEYKQEKMYYTSGKVIQSGFVAAYGTYVIRARLPKGKHLLPSIYLLPVGQRDETCKYEEIDIVQARGQRPSTLILGAHYGKSPLHLLSKTQEKVLRGKDFSADFHEFAIQWTPTRIQWYVDGKRIYETSTHYASDWVTKTGDNVPSCDGEQKVFGSKSMLVLSLSVGGSMFPESKYGVLRSEEAYDWTKPTLEIDSVKIYDSSRKEAKEKITVFNIPGIDGLDLQF